MRKIKTGLCLFVLILFSSSISFGQELTIEEDRGPLRVYIDGRSCEIPEEAYIDKDRTFVRADVIEKTFSLQSSKLENGRLQLRGQGFDLILPLDKAGGTFNGDLLPMVFFGQIKDGYIYYPLKLIGEKKGYVTTWKQGLSLVLSQKKKAKKGEKKEIYWSEDFILYGSPEDQESFYFRGKSKELKVFYRDKNSGKESFLGRISRTKKPGVKKDQGILLGFSKDYFYEFYWDKNFKDFHSEDISDSLNKILFSFEPGP